MEFTNRIEYFLPKIEQLLQGYYLLYRERLRCYELCMDPRRNELPRYYAPPRALRHKDLEEGYFYTYSDRDGYEIGFDADRIGCLGIWSKAGGCSIRKYRGRYSTPTHTQGWVSDQDRLTWISSHGHGKIYSTRAGVFEVSQLSTNRCERQAILEDCDLLMALAVSRTPRSSQPARATNRSSSSREQEAEMEAGQLTRDQRKLQADQQALSTKSVQLQNQENSIKQRQDALQQRENDLQKRQSAVQQRDNELQRRQTTMQQGETALQKRQTTMQEKETDLQKRLTNMQGKEKDLQSREEDLKRRDAAFRRAKDAADRVKTPNAEIQAGLEKRERDVQKRVDEVKEREAAVAALEQELQAKMADVTLDAESRNHELPDKRTDDDTVASSASVEGSRAPTPAPPEDLGTPADDVPETQTPPVVPDADDAWGAWGGGPTTVKPQESDAFSVKAGKKKKKGKK